MPIALEVDNPKTNIPPLHVAHKNPIECPTHVLIASYVNKTWPYKQKLHTHENQAQNN